jgi:hypothetical protein
MANGKKERLLAAAENTRRWAWEESKPSARVDLVQACAGARRRGGRSSPRAEARAAAKAENQN